MVDEDGFAAAAPCKTEGLLDSVAWGAGVEGATDMEGAREAECVIEEQGPEGIVVLDRVIDVGRGVREFFDLIDWWPCNSFSGNITS
jgi:hypothetical protein